MSAYIVCGRAVEMGRKGAKTPLSFHKVHVRVEDNVRSLEASAGDDTDLEAEIIWREQVINR